jgi:hypothetical protein
VLSGGTIFDGGADLSAVIGYQLLVASSGNWRDALFYGLVFTHAVSALVGFGSIGFAGTYAARAYLPSGPYLPHADRPSADRPSAGSSLGDGQPPEDHDLSPGNDLGPGESAAVSGSRVRAGSSTTGGAVVAGGLAPAAGPRAGQATTAEAAEEDAEFEELRRYFRRPAQLWRAVLLVPLLGLGALAADPDGGGLDQGWVLGALLVWLAATLVAASLVLPGLYQLRSMILSPTSTMDASAANREAERIRFARAKALAARGAACCDVLFFVALALMVWRP